MAGESKGAEGKVVRATKGGGQRGGRKERRPDQGKSSAMGVMKAGGRKVAAKVLVQVVSHGCDRLLLVGGGQKTGHSPGCDPGVGHLVAALLWCNDQIQRIVLVLLMLLQLLLIFLIVPTKLIIAVHAAVVVDLVGGVVGEGREGRLLVAAVWNDGGQHHAQLGGAAGAAQQQAAVGRVQGVGQAQRVGHGQGLGQGAGRSPVSNLGCPTAGRFARLVPTAVAVLLMMLTEGGSGGGR